MTALHISALAAVDLADFGVWCAERRDEAVEEIDADPLAGVEDDEWPDGSALPPLPAAQIVCKLKPLHPVVIIFL